MRVYLSGSTRKGSGDTRAPDYYWSEADLSALRLALPEPDVVFVDPAKSKIRRQDQLANFGCDLYLVATSDLILVDARTGKGVGVGAEMMYATFKNIPVVTWVPRDTHYRRSVVHDVYGENLVDWVHPFIVGLSDYMVETIEEAIAIVSRAARGENLDVKKSPELAIAHFRTRPEAARLLVD